MTMARTAIPGLNRKPTAEELRVSCRTYNSLPEDHEQPLVSQQDLIYLSQLLQSYHVQDIFGIHLVHRHSRTLDDHVMLGSRFNRTGWWTKPTHIDAIGAIPVYGHIYTITPDGGMIAYEFRKGQPPDQNPAICLDFFEDLADYLIKRGLYGLLGLEVLTDAPRTGNMLEIVIDGYGTVMISAGEGNTLETRRVTGWVCVHDSGGIISMKGNEGHSRPPGGQHVVFTDGKLLHDDEALMEFLQTAGIWRTS